MSFIDYLVEETKTASGIIVPDHIARQASGEDEFNVGQVAKFVRNMAKQGHIDNDTLKELVQAQEMVDKLVKAAQAGKIEVRKGGMKVNPKAVSGSNPYGKVDVAANYNRSIGRKNEPSKFERMQQTVLSAIKDNPDLKWQINKMLSAAHKQKMAGAKS